MVLPIILQYFWTLTNGHPCSCFAVFLDADADPDPGARHRHLVHRVSLEVQELRGVDAVRPPRAEVHGERQHQGFGGHHPVQCGYSNLLLLEEDILLLVIDN